MKITLFYLLETKSLYAYSENNDFIKKFKSQRNMKLFKVVTKDIDKYQRMVFLNKNSGKQMITDYLSDEENTFEIISTVEESDKLSESTEYISDTMTFTRRCMMMWDLKEKYLNIITKITDVISEQTSDDDNPTLKINTLDLFYYLFKNTFIEKSIEDE